MKEPTENIRTYHVKFSIGTAHYESHVQAYGKDTAKKLLEAQYPNCKLSINSVEIEEEGDAQ